MRRYEWEKKQREVEVYIAASESRPAWVSEETFSVSKRLQGLDHLAAQRELAALFEACAPGSAQVAALHQVDYELGLQAWKLLRGEVSPDPSWAGQKTAPIRSLDPRQIAAVADRERRRARRQRNAIQ